MKLINWNSNNRAAQYINGQARWLAAKSPDIIVLSELNYNHIGHWRSRLGERGYGLVAEPQPVALGKQNMRGEVIAARLPIRPIELIFGHGSSPQVTVLAQVTLAGGRPVELHAVYAPPDSNREPGVTTIKPVILETVARVVGTRTGSQVIAGDFNAPQAELADGTWVSFSCNRWANGEWYLIKGRTPERAAFWSRKNAAELAIKKPRPDMDCAFQNAGLPYSPRDTWRSRTTPFRLDHLICSQDVMPDRVWYSDYQKGLSDHRPMIAEWD